MDWPQLQQGSNRRRAHARACQLTVLLDQSNPQFMYRRRFTDDVASRSYASAMLPGVTTIFQEIGSLAKHWFYFQQARHPQKLACLTVG